ncbi:uncharacterized protein LOC132192756 [Neocloeon triangulifer]|uniref:uncharacterized protein LOC132192756 n=1 Tax=Neocloeon triangulifer TaxID=2078957 RepID=UPI00286F9988|nr:uncharacterized protein LOC132192756 [Neocloeon triangulifer]
MLKALKQTYTSKEKSLLKDERKNLEESHVGDQILEDIGRSIKLLLQYGLTKEKIRSELWVVQDLCHRLDVALRHGLRRPSAGYWPYVRHFTHTDNVKLLERTCSRRRATLDKSSAWLYHSLNEGSLESYLRAFAREGNLVSKHFYKFALLRDEQQRDLLVGLLASIQDFSFDIALQSFESVKSSEDSLPSPEDSGIATADSDLSEIMDSLGDRDESSTLNEIEDNRINKVISMDMEKVVLRSPRRDPQRHLKRVSFNEELKKEFFSKRHSWCMESSITSSTLSLPYDDQVVFEGDEPPTINELQSLQGKLELIKQRRKLFLKKAALGKKKQVNLRLYYPKAVVDKEACRETELQISREMQKMQKLQVEDKNDMYLDERLLEILRKDVFEKTNESISKVFKGYGPILQPGISPLLIILTNLGLYAVCHSDSKIKPKFSCSYEQLEAILFGPEGQTVLFSSKSKDKYLISLSDCPDSTPAAIISSIELAMRKLRLLPAAWKQLTLPEMKALQRSLTKIVPSLKGEQLLWHQVVHVQDASRHNGAAEAVKEGLLMIRIGNDGPWQPSYLVLRDCELWVFGDELDHEPQLVVGVARCVACGRVQLPERPHTFEIQCGRSSLPLQLAAADEYEVSEWLQALLQAACGQHAVQQAKLQLCGLVLSSGHLLVYRLDRNSPDPVFCTQLIHVTAIRAADSTWCTLEFECTEAKENGGDWILYFDCAANRAEFFQQMEAAWAKLPQVLPVPSTNFVSDLLLQRCEEASVQLISSWNPLINFG